jgi:hypothetical protein
MLKTPQHSTSVLGALRLSKRPPDNVSILRIEMQQKERELLESAVTAYQIQNISKPIVALLSDVTAMITILGLVGYFIDQKIMNILDIPDRQDLEDLYDQTKEQAENYVDAKRSVWAKKTLDFTLGGGFSPLGIALNLAGIASTPAELFGISPTDVVLDTEEFRQEKEEQGKRLGITGLIVLGNTVNKAKKTFEGLNPF